MAKTNRTSKKNSDDLDELRDAYRRHKEGRKGGGGGANDWHKLGDGKNMCRVLPRPGVRKFYTEGWTHFGVGPNQKAVRCIDEAKINVERGLPESGTKCPLCKKFLREQSRINSEYQKGDEDGRAEWKRAKDRYAPRHQYYCNVLVEDDEGDFVVRILAFGAQIWSQLMNFYLGDDTNIGDFTDPEAGRWMNLKKEKKGGRDRRNVEYKVYPADETSDISDAWGDIEEALHDLDAATGKILSKDEVEAIMKGVDPDKDDSDDDSDDDSSDSGSRRRRRSRDDDDDDQDEEEEEDDDADDDRSHRRQVKSSNLSKKMGKSRRGDD